MALVFTLASGWENLLKYSEDFTNAVWIEPSAGDWSVVGDSVRAPDGVVSADTITVDAADNSSLIRQQSLGINVGSTYTFTAWVKVLSGTITGLDIDVGDDPLVNTISQLVDGEWVRIVATVTAGSAYDGIDILVSFSGASATLSIWGAQLTEYTAEIPYVKTTSAALSKNSPENFITIDVEYDYKLGGNKIEDFHRAKDGGSFVYKWGDFSKIEFSLRYVPLNKLNIINSWWLANSNVLFSNNFTGDNFFVHITNKSTPIDKVERPYIDLHKGKVILETYE